MSPPTEKAMMSECPRPGEPAVSPIPQESGCQCRVALTATTGDGGDCPRRLTAALRLIDVLLNAFTLYRCLHPAELVAGATHALPGGRPRDEVDDWLDEQVRDVFRRAGGRP
jgi:hypothetical protein